MPVHHIENVKKDEDHERLVGNLYNEWTGESDNNEPVIVTEGGVQEAPRHVYVVWEAWIDLDHRERSEIIMEAAERKYSPEATILITVAMGLTREEARQMKMAKSLGIE